MWTTTTFDSYHQNCVSRSSQSSQLQGLAQWLCSGTAAAAAHIIGSDPAYSAVCSITSRQMGEIVVCLCTAFAVAVLPLCSDFPHYIGFLPLKRCGGLSPKYIQHRPAVHRYTTPPGGVAG